MLVRLFCDGASSNNQDAEKRVGGYGIVAYIKASEDNILKKEWGATVPGATNNQMELTAILEGLKAIDEDKRETASIHIQSDSAYSVNIFTKWIESWKNKGWKKKGGPIENLELIKEIDSIIPQYKVVKFEHVPRCSNQWITQADKIASEYAGSK